MLVYRIGVDLGGTNIVVGVVDEQNQIAASAHTPTRPERGESAVMSDIIGCIDNALLLSGLSPEDCAGIGIGSPGSCDRKSGVVRNAHNLGWREVPVCRLLEKAFGLPAFLENDANCAAYGESIAGAARGASNALMITLGTGIGSGMVLDGKIYSGFHGLGGELGHMCIAMDGEMCSCRRRGCWEAYASATALVNQARRALERHPESALASISELDGESIFRACAEGDAAASELVSKYCEYVAVGITNAVNMLSPEIVIIGGGISGQGERLLTPIRKYVAENRFARGIGEAPGIVRAQLGGDAGLIGAAALCGDGSNDDTWTPGICAGARKQ